MSKKYPHKRLDELLNRREAAFEIMSLVQYTNHKFDEATAELVLEVAYKMHDEAFEALVYEEPLALLEMLLDLTDDESHKRGLKRIKSLRDAVIHDMYDTKRLVNSSPLQVVVGLLREIGLYTKFQTQDITEELLRKHLADAFIAKELRTKIAELHESNSNMIKMHNAQMETIVKYTCEIDKLEQCAQCGESFRECRCHTKHNIAK